MSDGIIIQGSEQSKKWGSPLIQGNGDYLSFERNCDGVIPVNFLKATLKAERVLNPLS